MARSRPYARCRTIGTVRDDPDGAPWMRHKFSLRRRPPAAAVLLAFFSSVMSGCQGTSATASETVTFKNGDLVLHGLLYRPAGSGPVPVVLFNHGRGPG